MLAGPNARFKSLTIVGSPAALIEVGNGQGGASRVRNLTSGQIVLVSDLRIDRLEISNCQGSVRVTRVQPIVSGLPNGGEAAVTSSTDVTFSGCTLTGRRSLVGGVSGSTAVQIQDSNVALYDSALLGGAGFSTINLGSAGGDGISITNASVLLSACTSTGGAGGQTGPIPPCGTAGVGGAGIRATSSAPSSVHLLSTTAAGGAGGANPCAGVPAPAGAAIVAPVGVLDVLPGASRSISAPTKVREGTTFSITLQGQVGDQVLLLISPQTRWIYEPLFQGVMLYGPAGRRARVATLTSNTATVDLVAPVLPLGVDAMMMHLQCLFTDTSGQRTLSGPATEVFHDAAF